MIFSKDNNIVFTIIFEPTETCLNFINGSHLALDFPKTYFFDI